MQSRRELMRMFAEVRRSLRAHGIRDAEDYAEVLVADATSGQRCESAVNRGYDVIAPGYDRIEVKCRQLPLDGRIEERVSFQDSKAEGFDFAAIVIFDAGFEVRGAVLVPYASVWPVVASHLYRRISYSRATRLVGAVDITGSVRLAADR